MGEVTYNITGWAGVLVGAAMCAFFLAWFFVLPALGFFWLLEWLR